MPHPRKRYGELLIRRALSHSPIVGVLGQRQVGKTTLLEDAAAAYVSLDKESTLRELQQDPELFVASRGDRFAIDEAQLAPRLFPALKERVREVKRPGQFLLSGSVRFTSRRAIRESLTGRISIVELLPFSRAELDGEPLPKLLSSLTGADDQRGLEAALGRTGGRDARDFARYLDHGGLPGICFFRSPAARSDRLETQIDTLLSRDLRLVQETSLPYQALRELLVFLADRQGLPFEIGDAVRATQISAVTVRRLLFSYEALFLIRRVPSVGDATKATFFLEDQGFATWLSRKPLYESQAIVRGLYANLRQEIHYRPELKGRIFQMRTKHGVEVPLVFEAGGRQPARVGVLAVPDRVPTPKTLASAVAFLRRFPRFKAVIAYGGEEVVARRRDLFLVPYPKLI